MRSNHESRWNTFLDAREGHLRDLGAVILPSVSRDDTRWPIFHGCYDWHSAVHGVYALHVLARLTEEPSYTRALDALMTSEALALELRELERGSLDHECPYGFAWFLVLAIERARLKTSSEFDELANGMADRLEGWLRGLDTTQFDFAVKSNSYGNLSWALLALWQFAEQHSDTARMERLGEVAARLLEYDDVLPLRHDLARIDDFFPPALHRFLALCTILPAEELDRWLTKLLPQNFLLTPLTRIHRPHPAGLNFSRAWGLWALWTHTGDVRWRSLFLDHIEAHMALPKYWAKNYLYYSHWVPQFGVHAIGLTFENVLPASSAMIS